MARLSEGEGRTQQGIALIAAFLSTSGTCNHGSQARGYSLKKAYEKYDMVVIGYKIGRKREIKLLGYNYTLYSDPFTFSHFVKLQTDSVAVVKIAEIYFFSHQSTVNDKA